MDREVEKIAKDLQTVDTFKKLVLSDLRKVKSSSYWQCECPELIELMEQLLCFVYFNRNNPQNIKEAIDWVQDETHLVEIYVKRL